MDTRAYYEGVISSVKNLIAELPNGYTASFNASDFEALGIDIAQKIADSGLLQGENEFGNTGLMLAASWDFTKRVRYVPEKLAADIWLNRALNDIPKHIFLILILKLLAQPNYNVDAANHDGDTALICAARAGNINFVRTLLKMNADPRLKNKKGETADQVTKKFIIRKLIQSEILENKLKNFQRLRAIIAKQSAEDIKEDVHAIEHMENLQTLSFRSAIYNLDFILEHLHEIQDFSFLPSVINRFSNLLKNHVVEGDIIAQVIDEGAVIASDISAKYKKPEIEENQSAPKAESETQILSLLKSSFKLAGSVLQFFRGSDAITINNFENAIINGEEEVVLQYLDENELDPSIITDEYKNTPLILAASGGKLELVKLFLDLGANPILKDKGGRIAEDRADSVEIRHLLHNIPEYMLLAFQDKRRIKCKSSNTEKNIDALISLTIRSAISDIDFIFKHHDANHALFPELIIRMANLFASLSNNKRFEKYSHNLLKVAAHFGHDVAKHIVESYKDPEIVPKTDRIHSAKLKSLFKLFTDPNLLMSHAQITEDKFGNKIDRVKGFTQ